MGQVFLKHSFNSSITASYRLLIVLFIVYEASCKCQPSNCNQCSSDWVCQTCESGYFVSSGLCCMNKCSTCSSTSRVTYCTACVNNSYAIQSPSNQCVLCSSIMPNCLTCSSQASCTTCAASYSNGGNACYNCASMTGCTACSSSTVCTSCANTTLLLNSTSKQCVACSTLITNCQQCTSQTSCTKCAPSYINNGTSCFTCSSMTGCTACSSATVCTTCANTTLLLNATSRQCEACSTLISGCLECASQSSCTVCATNYTNNGTACFNCAEAMDGCLECTSQSSCTICATNYTNNGTACFNCAQAMDGCVACTSATVCTACANSSVAINSSNSQCVACSSLLAGCSTCTSEIFCTLCLNASFALNNVTNACDPCALMPQCSTCSSASVCTACVNDSFALNSSLCTVCESVLLGCLHCSSSSECIDCVNNTFAFNASNSQCVACSAFMPFCTSCNSSAVCVSCEGGPNIVLFNQNCASCSSVIPNCLNCSSSNQCTVCRKHYAISSNYSCTLCTNLMYRCLDCSSPTVCTKCSFGQIVINGCTHILGCVAVVQTFQDAICTLCDSASYLPQPVNGICVCKTGHMAGQYCTDIVGCTNVIKNNNGVTCTICDSSKNFILSNGTCVCKSYHQLSGQRCVQICGDGKLIYLSCDDGNTINGDGCSSTCQIEPNYICKDGTVSNPSHCIFKGMVQFLPVCVYKLENNVGQIIMTTNPFVSNILKSNLTIYFNTSKKCTMISFQTVGSDIIIKFAYNQDMEGEHVNLTIEYDKKYILSPNSSKDVELNECNGQRLQFDLNPSKSYKQTITLTVKIMSGLVLLIWLIGSYSHKMIGVQTLHTFQLIFISHTFAARYLPVVIYFNQLYNTLNIYEDKLISQQPVQSPLYNRLHCSADFAYNESVVIFFQGIILAPYLALKICQKFYDYLYSQNQGNQKDQKTKMNKQNLGQYNSKIKKIGKNIQILYNFLVFPFSIGFIMNFIMSLMVYSNANINKDFQNYLIQTSAILLISFSVLLVFFSEWKFSLIKRIFKFKENYKQNYIPFYLTNIFVVSFIIQASFASLINNTLLSLAVFFLLQLILLLIYRPYHDTLHNIGLLVNHIGILLNLAWLISQEYLYLTRRHDQIIAFVIIGWMALILAFAILRIIYELRKRQIQKHGEKRQQRKINANNMKIYRDYEETMRKNIIEQVSTNINAYLITSQLLSKKKQELQELGVKRNNHLKSLQNKIRQERQPIQFLNYQSSAAKRRIQPHFHQ